MLPEAVSIRLNSEYPVYAQARIGVDSLHGLRGEDVYPIYLHPVSRGCRIAGANRRTFVRLLVCAIYCVCLGVVDDSLSYPRGGFRGAVRSLCGCFDQSRTAPRACIEWSCGRPPGAIVPGAEIDLVDATGAVTGTSHTDDSGNFRVVAPHEGSFTLVVSEPGFETVRTPVVVVARAAAKAALPIAARLKVVLPIAAFATTVQVSAENNADLTASEENRDSSVMTRRS